MTKYNVGDVVKAIKDCESGHFKQGDVLQVTEVLSQTRGEYAGVHLTHPYRGGEDIIIYRNEVEPHTIENKQAVKAVELATLSTEQAAALESVKNVHDNESIVTFHFEKSELWTGEWIPLNELSIDTLCRALYVGYTTQKTPEELIKEKYDEAVKFRNSSEVASTVAITIEEVLEIFNIRIDGINQ